MFRLGFFLSPALAVCAMLAFAGLSEASDTAPLPDLATLSQDALLGSEAEKMAALDHLVARGNLDIAPTLVFIMRLGGEHVAVANALSRLTGVKIQTWRDAVVWQEANPQIVPHPSFYDFKLRYLTSVDKRFRDFFPEDLTQMRIRFEEVVWGGVLVDGIPSLDNPEMIAAEDADYLRGQDLVFGVSINGDARAYPLRILGWHEMFNDVVGGVPVALAYCTLCGAGILFETKVEGQEPLVFGSSGLLYRSNKLMYDRQTRSLWNQFTGEAVAGPMMDAGVSLKMRPVTIASWADWRAANPATRVLSLQTGYIRDYDPGVVYRDYFASPDLMFPTTVGAEDVARRKDYVFGIRTFGAARAWPLAAFAGGRVINDRVGDLNVVLIGDAATRTVRAYARGDMKLTAEDLHARWQIGEDALTGPNGDVLPRIAGHVAYWFAWDRYLGLESTLYDG